MNPKMTFNPSLPNYIGDVYDRGVLVKFFQTEWQRDYFLSGKLYMRPQTDFSDAEMGNGRCDIIEGADIVVLQRSQESFPDIRFEIEDGQAVAKIYEYKERPENYRDNQAFISYPIENQKRNLFCMYTLWFDSNKEIIMPIEKDKLEPFGQYGAVIIDFYEFLRRVGNSLNHEPTVIAAKSGFVSYLENKDLHNVMNADPFYKVADAYGAQNEFRILAETDNKDLLELQVIDGLIDITIPIRLDSFVSSLHVENGAIRFKADKE